MYILCVIFAVSLGVWYLLYSFSRLDMSINSFVVHRDDLAMKGSIQSFSLMLSPYVGLRPPLHMPLSR